MKIEQFSLMADLSDKSELKKVEHLAFYFQENKKQPEFTIKDMSAIMVALGFAQPNLTRLKAKIQKSISFVKAAKKDFFRLSVKRASSLRAIYPNLSESEEIISDDSLLPEVLFKETNRQYLIKAAQQINAAYENNLFDATYQNLKTLINKAMSSSQIGLSSNAKKDIHSFRGLGNLSAHRVMYSCRRDDIRTLRVEYRAVIEELLYAANLAESNKKSRQKI